MMLLGKKENCVRGINPSRSSMTKALFLAFTILLFVFYFHNNFLEPLTYEPPSVYIIDDFSNQPESHGTLIYNLICENLSKEHAEIHHIDISLNGSSSSENLNRLLRNLLNEDVDLINMSFGVKSYNQTTFDLLEQFGERGTIIIAAAGNNGEDYCQYPAAYDLECIVSVGAAELNGQIASYSNYGQDVDVFVKTPNAVTDFLGTSAACAVLTNSILRERITFTRAALDDHLIDTSELIRRGDYMYYFYIPDGRANP